MTWLTHPGLRRFMRYATVGVVNNALAYGVFLALIAVGVAAVLASGMVYCLALATSYVANRLWTFEAKGGSHRRDMPRYLGAYLIGLGFSMASVAFWVTQVSPAWAQAITMVTAPFVIYSCLLLFRFGQEA